MFPQRQIFETEFKSANSGDEKRDEKRGYRNKLSNYINTARIRVRVRVRVITGLGLGLGLGLGDYINTARIRVRVITGLGLGLGLG